MGNKISNVNYSLLLFSLWYGFGGGGVCFCTVLYSLPSSAELVQLKHFFLLFFRLLFRYFQSLSFGYLCTCQVIAKRK